MKIKFLIKFHIVHFKLEYQKLGLDLIVAFHKNKHYVSSSLDCGNVKHEDNYYLHSLQKICGLCSIFHYTFAMNHYTFAMNTLNIIINYTGHKYFCKK